MGVPVRQVGVNELLTPERRERIEEIHAFWAPKTLQDTALGMPEPTVFNVGGKAVSAVVVPPRAKDIDIENVLVRMAEHQQPYTPFQYMSACILRDVVAPESPIIMFQNNGLTQSVRTIDTEIRKDINMRGLSPLAEQNMLILDRLGFKNVALTGWSIGASMAVEMAKAGSNKINISHLNVDEAPSQNGRNIFQLLKDFRDSGSKAEQIKAIHDADLPAISRRYASTKLNVDYAKFFIAGLLPSNISIMRAATESIGSSLLAARMQNPDVHIKLGSVVESRMFSDIDRMTLLADEVVEYAGFYKHPTVNNPFIQALMADDGINPS